MVITANQMYQPCHCFYHRVTRNLPPFANLFTTSLKAEYCGQCELAVRSFELLFVDVRAEREPLINKTENNKQPLENCCSNGCLYYLNLLPFNCSLIIPMAQFTSSS